MSLPFSFNDIYKLLGVVGSYLAAEDSSCFD